jgi:hypothetical protein
VGVRLEVRLRRRLEIRAHRSVVVPPVHRAGLLCAIDLPQQLRVQALPPEPSKHGQQLLRSLGLLCRVEFVPVLRQATKVSPVSASHRAPG